MLRVFFLLFLATSSCAQSNSNWNELEIVNDVYPIKSEDGIYLSDFDEPNDTIRAAIQVKNEDNVFSSIVLSKAELLNDTLKIDLWTTNSAYHHEYQIVIVGKKYFIKYRFAASPGYIDGLLAPLETKLKLNTGQFKKGTNIRGYTEFKTKCIKPCHDGIYIASGNFKATIR
jgi:hypothetical protein